MLKNTAARAFALIFGTTENSLKTYQSQSENCFMVSTFRPFAAPSGRRRAIKKWCKIAHFATSIFPKKFQKFNDHCKPNQIHLKLTKNQLLQSATQHIFFRFRFIQWLYNLQEDMLFFILIFIKTVPKILLLNCMSYLCFAAKNMTL